MPNRGVKVEHNAYPSSRREEKKNKNILSLKNVQIMISGDIKVEDKRVHLLLDRNFSGEEKVLITKELDNYDPPEETSSRHKYCNQLVDHPLGGRVKFNYYYDIYFFFEEKKLMIVTSNGNIARVLSSFNNWLKDQQK